MSGTCNLRRTGECLTSAVTPGVAPSAALPRVAIGAILVVLLMAGGARAAVFSFGDLTPVTEYSSESQGFTPSAQGTGGTVAPSYAYNQVQLLSLAVDFLDPASGPSTFYIHGLAPSDSDANSGSGSLASGSYVGNEAYDFAAQVTLSFNAKYFAVLPSVEGIWDGTGSAYAGGLNL